MIITGTGIGPWLVRFICCGREGGDHRCGTWEQADALRESYCAPDTGHIRVAIISLADGT
jgi:hypothetical protein